MCRNIHTPYETDGLRQMKQNFCAKRNRQLTPNETGYIRQTIQTFAPQPPEIIHDFAAVLRYLSTSIKDGEGF